MSIPAVERFKENHKIGRTQQIQTETTKMEQSTIQICIRTATGKNITLEVEGSDTVESVKKKPEEIEGFPYDQQRLLFSQKVLEDEKSLSEYNLQKDSIIRLQIRGRGRDCGG